MLCEPHSRACSTSEPRARVWPPDRGCPWRVISRSRETLSSVWHFDFVTSAQARGAWPSSIAVSVVTTSFFMGKKEKEMLIALRDLLRRRFYRVVVWACRFRNLPEAHPGPHVTSCVTLGEITGTFWASVTSAGLWLSPVLENRWHCCGNINRIDRTEMRIERTVLPAFLLWGILHYVTVACY